MSIEYDYNARAWTDEERGLIEWFLTAYKAKALPQEKFYLSRPFMLITHPESFYWALESESGHAQCETVRAMTGAFQSDLRLLRSYCAEDGHANLQDVLTSDEEGVGAKEAVSTVPVLPEPSERGIPLCDLF